VEIYVLRLGRTWNFGYKIKRFEILGINIKS
jgi:hypothetical protein